MGHIKFDIETLGEEDLVHCECIVNAFLQRALLVQMHLHETMERAARLCTRGLGLRAKVLGFRCWGREGNRKNAQLAVLYMCAQGTLTHGTLTLAKTHNIRRAVGATKGKSTEPSLPRWSLRSSGRDAESRCTAHTNAHSPC